MSNLPFKASLIPSSWRMGCANCGLQLNEGEGEGYQPNTADRLVCMYAYEPQQDDVGLLHRRNVLSDGDLDGVAPNDGSKFLAQALRAFFAPDARDEAGGQRRVVVGDVGRGRSSGRVGLPLGLAASQAV